MNNKISLIIPMYNIENYIEKCLKSISDQSYENYEVIVVNDGSSDNSLIIAKKYENEKIKVLTKENGGLSSARNYGLRFATGEYIWFVDGDDYIEKDSLRKLNDKINEESYDVISFRYYIDNGKEKKELIDRIDWDNSSNYPLVSVSAWSRIFKTEFLKKNNIEFAEGLIYEDLELIPFLLCIAEKIGFIKEPLYDYVYREGSIMNQKKFKNNRDDKFIVLDRLISKFKDKKIYSKYKEQLEFLAIRHLVFVYTTEILIYKKEIYINRCERANKYLKYLNSDWIHNKYLNDSPLSFKIFARLFSMKQYYICKLLVYYRSLKVK